MLDIAAQFGDNLSRCRKRADMSQDELSVLASLHRTEISQLERGLRIARVDTLAKLYGSLEVEPGDLLVGSFGLRATCGSGALGSRLPMAEGIRKRHSKSCSARDGGRCNCNAGWEASIFLAREGRRVTKTFRRRAEAKSWRAEAKRAADKGTLQTPARDSRTLAGALRQFIAGMGEGTIRPKGRERYKPNTIRSYERALRVHIAPTSVGGVKVVDVRRRDPPGSC